MKLLLLTLCLNLIAIAGCELQTSQAQIKKTADVIIADYAVGRFIGPNPNAPIIVNENDTGKTITVNSYYSSNELFVCLKYNSDSGREWKFIPSQNFNFTNVTPIGEKTFYKTPGKSKLPEETSHQSMTVISKMFSKAKNKFVTIGKKHFYESPKTSKELGERYEAIFVVRKYKPTSTLTFKLINPQNGPADQDKTFRVKITTSNKKL